MNTRLQIKFKGDLYRFCNSLNQETYQICKVVIGFVGFEDKSTENMMNIDFLKKYKSRLYPYLYRMFYINKSSICCFLDAEYFYTLQERSGRTCQLFLTYMIKRIEPTNLDNIKRKFRELLYADVHPDERNDFFYELVYYF